MLTRSEEDHVKAVHALLRDGSNAFTKDIAERLGTKASSVTVMLKKLAEKGLLKHEPYHGVSLTAKGQVAALKLVRKHRLWETFLVQRLGFGWDEVHEVAEQLEHVGSDKLTDSLDEYLGHPAFDPHGDPIPDRDGKVAQRKTTPLNECAVGARVRIAAVRDPSDALLHLLDQKGIGIGMVFEVQARQSFDGSLELRTKHGPACSLSAQVSAQLLIEPVKA
ncbi:MAG TPA: metal-dependent transcriptional regulator [Flavobacteriales bacterium]|jgi:DtxR family Mn-dependent transcriptional regulator|nr:metal-dependent transcriptional regulator [Flavobacteriales bacterium]